MNDPELLPFTDEEIEQVMLEEKPKNPFPYGDESEVLLARRQTRSVSSLKEFYP